MSARHIQSSCNARNYRIIIPKMDFKNLKKKSCMLISMFKSVHYANSNFSIRRKLWQKEKRNFYRRISRYLNHRENSYNKPSCYSQNDSLMRNAIRIFISNYNVRQRSSNTQQKRQTLHEQKRSKWFNACLSVLPRIIHNCTSWWQTHETSIKRYAFQGCANQ